MKLTVLVDNNTYIDRYFLEESEFLFHIEENGKNILFDVGYLDIFIKKPYYSVQIFLLYLITIIGQIGAYQYI